MTFNNISQEEFTSKWLLVDTLSKQRFSNVYLAQNIENKKLVICKNVKTEELYLNEIKMLQLLNNKHPCIIQLYGYLNYPNIGSMILLEYLNGGTLNQYRYINNLLNDKQYKCITLELVDAIHFLHRNMIMHRDIKLNNILCTSNNKDSFHIKLIDFGISRFLDPNQPFQSKRGTDIYMSPEIIKRMDITFDVDVWSLGVCLFYLLTSKYPFRFTDNENEDDIVYNIVNANILSLSLTYKSNKQLFKKFIKSQKFWEEMFHLFKQIFVVNINLRWNIIEIRNYIVRLWNEASGMFSSP